MLEELTFDLMIENPFSCLYNNLKTLRQDRNKPLRHAAWAFCSDACLTPVPLLLEAKDIAVASIFFASVYSGEIIDDLMNGDPWWKTFDTEESACVKAIDVMTLFYQENPLRKPQNPMISGKSPIFILENTRRRCETASSQFTASSAAPTPTGTDRAGTQSPRRPRTTDSEVRGPQETVRSEDSEASLKTAVNDLDSHETNGSGNRILSPAGKRKTPDDDGREDGHSQKRLKPTP